MRPTYISCESTSCVGYRNKCSFTTPLPPIGSIIFILPTPSPPHTQLHTPQIMGITKKMRGELRQVIAKNLIIYGYCTVNEEIWVREVLLNYYNWGAKGGLSPKSCLVVMPLPQITPVTFIV